MKVIKFEGREEKYKVTVMAVLLAAACLLTYYFHVVLGIGTFFTHLFYIPIILAALWWRKKGLVVPIFLAGFLIYSHIFLRLDVETAYDYLRAIMFMAVAFVVATLSEQIAKAEAIKLAYAELDQIFNTVANGLRLIDKDFKVLRFNEASLTLSGICRDEAIGKKCYEVFHSHLCHTPSCPMIQILGGEERVECEVEKERTDGTRIPGILTTIPFRGPDGKLIGIVEGFMDITERKRAEEEREHLIEELEAKNTEMERFTYTVSHDLRSPLITIQGFAGILREDLKRNEREKMENNLKFIENAATTMDHLLSDTLELSRIGRVVNPPEDVPFGNIVQEALTQTSEQIKSSGVDVSMAEDFPTVHVDRLRIVEVLVNLIVNSINYMGEQPHPKIEIGYRVDGEEIVFLVKDNGIGIDKDQHEKVFELFYRVDRSSKGTGAGLAIVKRIIEVHGGRIWIESEKGMGCTVCFSIPKIVKRER